MSGELAGFPVVHHSFATPAVADVPRLVSVGRVDGRQYGVGEPSGDELALDRVDRVSRREWPPPAGSH